MSRDEIIRMARDASFTENSGFNGCFVCNPVSLERFAALVAAAEREACAQMVEEWITHPHLAAAIRARGNS